MSSVAESPSVAEWLSVAETLFTAMAMGSGDVGSGGVSSGDVGSAVPGSVVSVSGTAAPWAGFGAACRPLRLGNFISTLSSPCAG